MRWPELNHHGDKAGNNVAVPAMMVTGDRRMSLSDEIDPEPLGDVDASHLPMYEKSIAGHQSLDDSHSEYTSYPPAVQHQQTYGEQYGGPYDWDGSDEGYAGMTRGSSPTMAGVGASNAVTYPQQAQPNTHHY
jgi:hypothetical protein